LPALSVVEVFVVYYYSMEQFQSRILLLTQIQSSH